MPEIWGENNGKNGEYKLGRDDLQRNYDKIFTNQKSKFNYSKIIKDDVLKNIEKRPFFEPSRYIKIEDCFECNKVQIDPKRDELTMHLHSLYYKVILNSYFISIKINLKIFFSSLVTWSLKQKFQNGLFNKNKFYFI